jgi:outer membrane translocation and assembly module TamA
VNFFVKNKIEINEEFAVLTIQNRQKEEVAKVLIDVEDVERVSKYAWSLNRQTGYIQNTRSYHEGKGRYIHQFIIGKKDGFEIDHINMDKLDNRKKNLRHTSRKANCLNNKFKGICWDKNREKWLVYIGHKYVGRYADKQDAINARKKAREDALEEALNCG